jgi:hypothetical protein
MTQLLLACCAALMLFLLSPAPADAQASSLALLQPSAATLSSARTPQQPALQLAAPAQAILGLLFSIESAGACSS